MRSKVVRLLPEVVRPGPQARFVGLQVAVQSEEQAMVAQVEDHARD